MNYFWSAVANQLPVGMIMIIGLTIIWAKVGTLIKEVQDLKVLYNQHILWHLDQANNDK